MRFHLSHGRLGRGRQDEGLPAFAAHSNAVDGKFVKEATGLVSVVDVESGDVLATFPTRS